MHRLTKLGLALAALTGASFAGCSCDDPPRTSQTVGEPVLELIGEDGVPVPVASPAELDFGPVLVGDLVERKLVVRNEGRGEFTIEGATPVEPFPSDFKLAFDPALLQVGGRKEYTVGFTPVEAGERKGEIDVNLADASEPSLHVVLKGLGIKGTCGVSPAEALDFGSVAIGSTIIRPVRITNESDIEWAVTVEDIASELDRNAFVYSGFKAGKHPIPPHGELVVQVQFQPTHKGRHTALLPISAPKICSPKGGVELTGSGVDYLLQCEPSIDENGKPCSDASKQCACKVDFGFVNPGSKRAGKVTLRNVGNRDLTVTGLTIDPAASPFAIEGTASTFQVSKNGGTADINLAFAPSLLGTFKAALRYTSDDPKRPRDSAELLGVGGGPDIDVSPKQVEFGPVALGTYQYRRISIANVGTDVKTSCLDNLAFGELSRDPATGVCSTSEEKRAELVTSFPDEFELEWPPQGWSTEGIAANQVVDLRVKLTPKSEGEKTALVRIRSNDPDEPVVEVPVVASAVSMPPCKYQVIPGQLTFGNVETGKTMSLSFFIKNLAASPDEECLISTLGFSHGTSSAYTLTNGPLTGASIKGGQMLEVPVRFSPRSAGDHPGTVEFYISSPTAPEGKVPLTGSSKKACLLIAPNDLDFGVIQVNCSSRERAFTVYNVCAGNAYLADVKVQDSLSTEFRITKQAGSYPMTLAPGAQAEFRATYRPMDIGEDAGSIAVVTVDQPDPTKPQVVTPYVVTVEGRGAAEALQTDVYAQDAQPKADVLFIIDNSCSMADEQDALAANFSSFIKFAVSQQVDYHIAVTTVSVDGNHGGDSYYKDEPDWENGRFVPLAGGNPRVITNSTPDKEQAFANNVQRGTDGSGTELLMRPAYLALTNPNLTGHNAGFLRDEAYLAVVVVSDAADQDPMDPDDPSQPRSSVSFYHNFFLNIKGFRRANMFTFSGIVPTKPGEEPGCDYDEDDAGQSTKIRELVSRTGGVLDEICQPPPTPENPDQGWAKALEKLGQTAFGFRTRFFLSNYPDLSVTPPIVVKLNGQPCEPIGPDGTPQWSYNSTVNAIDFQPLKVPEPGTTLEITYHVACLP